MLSDSQPRSSRGVSGDDPEGGARRGVLRRRLVTVRPGRRGTLPARHYDLAARSSLHGSGSCRRRKRGPRPKTATVARREASVPRHGTQGARRLACRDTARQLSARGARDSMPTEPKPRTAMSTQTIIVERRGRVGIVRLNRPQALNALNATLKDELLNAV